MSDLAVFFTPADEDVAAFRAQMARLTNDLGKSAGEAGKMGTIALLKALQASTRTAPQFRKIKPTGKADKQGFREYQIAWDHDVNERKRDIRWTFRGTARAESFPAAKIQYAGTAKASWGWAMWGLFQTGNPTYRGRKLTRRAVELRKFDQDGHFEVHVDNVLDYIGSAFHGGKSARKPTVDSALARAAAVMRGRIDQRLKGKLK